MKYTVSNTINRSMDQVMEKYKDPEGVKNWMDGLEKIERLSGSHMEVGAKSNFHFLYKGKQMQIAEEVLEEDLPRQIKYGFTSSMGYNTVEMIFEPIDDNSVRQTNNSYFEMRGFMKLIGFVMIGMFKKQSKTYITAFKSWVEE